MVLGVLDILKINGFDPDWPAKFVRHQDLRYPVDELRRNGWFELYQRYQGRPVFHQIDYIVSFYGLSGARAGFYGVFKVGSHRDAQNGETLSDCLWAEEWRQSARFFYDLELDTRFEAFRDRLIINWGPGARSWIQRASNKVLLEIKEPGRRLPPFEDYLEFSISYAQLQELFDNEEAHRDWREHLSAVSGVYLILAEGTGDLYVGSAYGAGGIWARWREYARTGHGGNAKLRRLIADNLAYPSQFRFSVLHILPKTMTRNEIIRRETDYKVKLGSRATGLNLN